MKVKHEKYTLPLEVTVGPDSSSWVPGSCGQSNESSCSCLVQLNDHELIMTETSRWDSFTTVLKDRVQFGSTATADFGELLNTKVLHLVKIWLAFLRLRWGWGVCAHNIWFNKSCNIQLLWDQTFPGYQFSGCYKVTHNVHLCEYSNLSTGLTLKLSLDNLSCFPHCSSNPFSSLLT